MVFFYSYSQHNHHQILNLSMKSLFTAGNVVELGGKSRFSRNTEASTPEYMENLKSNLSILKPLD